jgi:hypothetical protein
MLIHPSFKKTQRMRVSQEYTYEGWLPVLEDKATLAILSLMLIESGGLLRFSEGCYHIGDDFKSESLQEIICEGLIEAWDQSSDS